MKKAFCGLLAALLLLGSMTVQADYDHLTIGCTTPTTGAFFTNLWGTVTSDLDVRLLLHGYNFVEWNNEEGVFAIDPSVVSGIVVTENPEGDRTYTLTIYEDLVYCDGTAITAADYAFSMLLLMAPQMEEIGAALKPMEYILGYEEYVNGSTEVLAGIRILNPYTMSVTIDHRYLPFFYEMSLLDCTPAPISVIAPGCSVADDGEGIYIANADGTAGEPLFTAQLLEQTLLDPETGYLTHPTVTSGPYRLISYDGNTAEFEINPYYKGNSSGLKPSIPQLTFRSVENASMMEEMGNGQIDLINKAANADALTEGMMLIRDIDGYTMSNYSRSGLSFISFCTERQGVSGQKVRQAVSYCLDKEVLVSAVVRNFGLRVDGYYGMGQWMYQIITGASPYPVQQPAEDATPDEIAKYEETLAAWEALSLDDIRTYETDPEKAIRLLEEDGWVLNKDGGNYDPVSDEVRCKEIDGSLVSLELKLICPTESKVADSIRTAFEESLTAAGILLEVEEVPMAQLLQYYYRKEARDADMIYLATNFDIVFDPTLTFTPDPENGINYYNVSAIKDEELYELAGQMRQTQPGDLLGYCSKWIEFQKRFQETVPAIPVYSGMYFDFYPETLQNYQITSTLSWAQAIVGSYLSDAADAGTEEAEFGNP